MYTLVSELIVWKNVLRYSDCTMSIIKSTPDTLYVDLRVNPQNNNMGPQSMCSTMKIMDYARLDTQESPEVSSFRKYIVTML